MFDDTYTELVEQPWRQDCSGNERPWSPSDDLKQRWLEGMNNQSSGEVERLCQAIGLARCANLNSDEAAHVNTFFERRGTGGVNPNIVTMMLVTGASAPLSLWYVFFHPTFEQAGREGTAVAPITWILFGWFLRNPGVAPFAERLVRHSPEQNNLFSRFTAWEAALNPLIFPQPELGVLWEQTALNFHPKTRHPAGNHYHGLTAFSWALRWDRPAGKQMALARPPFSWASSQKIGLHPHAVPAHELGNPTRAQIEYFHQAGKLYDAWRFYLPVLNWPWATPAIPYPESAGEVLALTVMGHPPLKDWVRQASALPDLLNLLATHPASGLF